MSVKKDITSFCFSGGWAAKLEPGGLENTIKKYGKTDHNLVVSFDNSDDAAIYKLDDDKMLVSTVDMITPIINDPYLFGQIAAANSLSDVFAMGGKVLYALNVCSFPKEMDLRDADKIIEGALSKMNEIGAVIAGGHTIAEPSLLFGLSVTGMIEDGKYFANDMAKPKQTLILTKPFGIGVAYAANNNGLLSDSERETWLKTMTTLNYKASQIARKYVSTMTDVTGFGLIGHAYEIACASKLTFEIDYNKINFLANVETHVSNGLLTGASYTNYDYLKDKISSTRFENDLLLLCDPQTSGGLLLVVADDKKDELLQELQSNDIVAYEMGRTVAKKEKHIVVK